jgi:transposase-like protein
MIPKAQQTQIIEALKANPNARAVAREIGFAPSTVLRWARKAKIAVSKSGIKKLPTAKQTEIIEALKANPNARAAGRQVGVNPATVRKLAKIANIALYQGPPRKFSAETRAQIIEALKGNPNASAVARKTGNISISRVAELAKEANIRLPTNKGTPKKPQQGFGPQSFAY